MMDELKQMIIDHLEDGLTLERICKNHRLTVDKEYLEGFKQGLRVALKMINLVETADR